MKRILLMVAVAGLLSVGDARAQYPYRYGRSGNGSISNYGFTPYGAYSQNTNFNGNNATTYGYGPGGFYNSSTTFNGNTAQTYGYGPGGAYSSSTFYNPGGATTYGFGPGGAFMNFRSPYGYGYGGFGAGYSNGLRPGGLR